MGKHDIPYNTPFGDEPLESLPERPVEKYNNTLPGGLERMNEPLATRLLPEQGGEPYFGKWSRHIQEPPLLPYGDDILKGMEEAGLCHRPDYSQGGSGSSAEDASDEEN